MKSALTRATTSSTAFDSPSCARAVFTNSNAMPSSISALNVFIKLLLIKFSFQRESCQPKTENRKLKTCYSSTVAGLLQITNVGEPQAVMIDLDLRPCERAFVERVN